MAQDAATDDLWPMWRALTAEFRMTRLVRQILTSRAGWGIYGADVVSDLRRTRMADGALRVLEAAPDDLLERLAALAALNARRNEAMWRMAALFYATVPVTLLLAGLESAPDFVMLFLQTLGPTGLVIFLSMTVWLVVYFANQWRAGQIEAVVDLARIERGRPF